MNDRPTSNQIKMEIDRYFDLIKSMLDSQVGDKKERSKFDFREAQHHKPPRWSGRTDKIDFIEFSDGLKNWADSLHEESVDMMEQYEGLAQPVEDKDLDKILHEDIIKFNKALYTELIDCLTREPLKFVLSKPRGSGVAAWREIVHWYDPRSQVDKSAAYAKIVNPGKGRITYRRRWS